MILETGRLVLQPWQESDRELFIALQQDARVRRYFPTIPSRDRLNADFDRALDQTSANGFHMGSARLKLDGSFVGMLGLARLPPEARHAIPGLPDVEIGWILNHRFWGQGLAPEGARAWLDYAWSINLPEVVAFTAALNRPSQRVMERIGMIRQPDADFLHPAVEDGHPLRPHVLYRILSPASPR